MAELSGPRAGEALSERRLEFNNLTRPSVRVFAVPAAVRSERASPAIWPTRLAHSGAKIENGPIYVAWVVRFDQASRESLDVRIEADVRQVARAEEPFEKANHVDVNKGFAVAVNIDQDRTCHVLPDPRQRLEVRA